MRPMELMGAPALLPGQCFKCRSGAGPNREYFLDTGIDVELEGVLYLCNTCLTDIVRSCPDFYTKDEMDAVVNANNFLIEDAREKIKKYDDTVDALQAVGIDALALFEKAGKRLSDELRASKFDEENELRVHAETEMVRLQERLAGFANSEQQIENLTVQNGELDREVRRKTYRIQELEETIVRMHETGVAPPPVSEPEDTSYLEAISQKSAKESLISTMSLFNHHIPSEVEAVNDGTDGTDVTDDSESEQPTDNDPE